MATRINVKFVLIVAATLCIAAGVVGGLWVLQRRGDTSRYIRNGDQMMVEARALEAAGKRSEANAMFEQAFKQYGRAVSKEPADLSHVQKVEEALLCIRPETQDQADEFDMARRSILQHRVRYRPTDAEAHQRIVDEIYMTARGFDELNSWQDLQQAADEMWAQVPEGDPKRVYARLYRGMASMRAMGYSAGNYPAASGSTQDQLDAALKDLAAFVEAMPQHDLGQATLCEARLAVARQLRAGQHRHAAAALKEARESLDAALAAVPDGPETARTAALWRAQEFASGERRQDDPELLASLDRMAQLASGSNDALLLADAAGILSNVDRVNGLPRAIKLLQDYVDAHPDQHYQRWVLALLYNFNQQLDQSYEAAHTILTAEPVPVSTLARILPTMRLRAAGLMVDIEYRRWELADAADKAARLERVVAARDRLASMVAEPEKEPLLLKAEGKIALARQDYMTAAERLERAIRLLPADDFDTLWSAARALEERGQPGLALQRLERAAALRPWSAVLLSEKARLQYRVGQFDAAKGSAELALRIDPKNQLAGRVKTAVESDLAVQQDTRPTDQNAQCLSDAAAASADGDVDEVRRILTRCLETTPDPLPVLTELAQTELRAGNMDQARAYLAQARQKSPENLFLRQLEAAMATNDQVEALIAYLKGVYEGDEAKAAVNTLINLRALAASLERLAVRQAAQGEAEAAKESQSLAAKALREAERFDALAESLAPGDRQLLDLRFNQALGAQDWTKLETLLQQAIAANADGAGGLILRGRVELAKANFRQAVQLLTEATARSPHEAHGWQFLGRAYEGMGNFGEALAAYERAYNANPNERFVVRWYVNLLMQTGEKDRALRVLNAAAHTLPGDGLLREARLQIEAEVGDVDRSMRDRRAIMEKEPRNRGNMVALVALLEKSKPGVEHVLDASGKPKYTTDQWKMLPEKERSELLAAAREKWLSEAETILGRLDAESVAGDGGPTLDVVVLRADLLRARGQATEGETLLVEYAAAHRDQVPAHIALAAYQAGIRRADSAIKTLEAAIAIQDPQRREIDQALGEIYFSNLLWEQALEKYRGVAEATGDRTARLRMVECLTKLGRFDESAAALATAVGEGAHDYFTAMLEASILQGQADALYDTDRIAFEQKDKEAMAALAEAERLLPTSPLPNVRRAQRLLTNYQRSKEAGLLDDALRALERADTAQAGAEVTSRLRVEVLLAKGDGERAVGELRRLVERMPDSVSARAQLIEVLARNGEFQRAMDVVQDAINREPIVSLWHEAKGDLYVMRGDNALAAPCYREAYTLQPNDIRLAKYAELAMAAPRPDFKDIVAFIEAAKPVFDGNPGLRIAYARALMGAGRGPDALREMRSAYADIRTLTSPGDTLANWLMVLQGITGPDGAATYEQVVRELAGPTPMPLELLWIARTWSNQGTSGAERALDVLGQASALCPPDNRDLRLIIEVEAGQYQHQLGRYPEAVEAYQRVLDLVPDQVLAHNNLAYLYAEELKQPEKALEHAERANAIKPDDAAILDTLGWVRFKLRKYREAEDALYQSIKLEGSADNHYHLACVFSETDRLDQALIYLSRAGELKPSEALKADIDRLAETMRAKMARPGAAGPGGSP
jgi:tetratricopeptide (TPR) repeat protein